MAGVAHKFVSAKSDSSDTSLVRPTNWNDDHEITGPINPASDDGAALGTTALQFSDLFLATGAVINFVNGDVTITHATNTLTFAGASSGYVFDADLLITGGAAYFVGGTDVAILDGGTGSSTASGAFTNLKQAATTSATGVVEIALDSDVNLISCKTQ